MPTFRQRLARLAPYFKAGGWGIVVATIGSLIAAACEAGLSALMRPLVDKGFSANQFPLWQVPVGLIGIFTLRGLAGYSAEWALAWSAQRGVERLRSAMFNHLLKVHPAVFGQHSTSSLTNMLVYEVQGGIQLLVGSVLTLLKDSCTTVAMLCMLLWINWQLTLVVSLMIPAVGLVMRVIAPRLRRLTVQAQHAIDELAYVVEENVLAWRIVRLHDAADVEVRRFERSSVSLRRLMLKSVAAAAAMSPLSQIFGACAVSVVIVVALQQARTNGMTVGDFVAFVSAMVALTQPIKHLSDVASPITRGLAALERGSALLHEADAEQGGSHAPARARGEIELQDVGLQYRADHQPALSHLSLHVKPGETLALVGPSGAGKTSLINLLPRFLEPTSGSIRLDGVPLQDWDVRALRRQFALVSQDVVLFNDSVAANVALGETIDRERVMAALQGANLQGFVDRLPQGIDSPIGHNGNQLSGGQRQRLAIARALYKDAPMLILDEATSALDSESERAVQQALDRLMQGRTTLVIAHRLSTIERADRIVAMEAGRVVEQGSHAELLAAGGLYARLHAMQFRET
jgi:subfamily B ATP-binding cassette protein MsbA